MNQENVGYTFAKIVKKDKKSKKKPKFLSVEPDEEKVHKYFEEIVVGDDERIQLIPIKQKERCVSYITGQSGSGKTFWSKRYIDEYHAMYPKRDIFVFSYFTEDKSLDAKYIKRIPLGPEFVATALHLEDFKNSLCLLDDVDTIKDKVLRNKLRHILNSLLELGRHHNCEVLYISHLATKGFETQGILNEATSVTFFARVMPSRSLKYLLESYFGLSKTQIKRVKNLKSRHCTILKLYPNIIIYEGGAYVLRDDLYED